MADIASIVISPFLQVLFDRIASREFVDFFRGRKHSNKLLKKLNTALLSVNAVLEDAEGKQFTETSVKVWLDELKDVAYDADDIFNEIATKNLRRKLDSDQFGTTASKLRHFISARFFVNKIEEKMKDAIDTLEDLAKQIGVLGLRAGIGRQPLERPSTTSFVEPSIFGRHDEEEAIINSLLSNGASGDGIGVIAIVGMGGIGKTTLAQLVYNNNRLNEHFDFKAWVCVSEDFNVFRLTKTIVEKVTNDANYSEDLDQLQIKLNEKLTGKKFLLVLDDVWECAGWELLSRPFRAHGSKIIVTTRNFKVAKVMHASETHFIRELSKEDCWSIFEKCAFRNGNSNAYPQLEAIGRQIVKKCKGLPLAIKAIGDLLWFESGVDEPQKKLDVEEWDRVLRSELWYSLIEENGKGILPALGLSYKYLSPHLKRCFAYCSIFPKDYAFKKDELVLLWMAEGFLPQPQNKTMEEVGDDYFLALVSRSLFQRSKHDEHDTYVMHDLVSDLAKFVSKESTLCHEDDCSHEILSKTRHFSYFQNFDIKKFETFHESMRLRTIVELNLRTNVEFGLFVDDFPYTFESKFLLPRMRCLRVLILSNYRWLSELPDAMGKFKQLHYLDLSNTRIERLPNSICKLCNLQILNLSYCRRLTALPRDMHKLINLRHLNIVGTGIVEMPINLGELKCLQTLSTFIVSKHSGCGIEELGKLTNLRGSLSVQGLQSVESPTDAKGKNLKDTKYLEELVLKWKFETTALESCNIVLDSLEPHSILKRLSIYGYGGTSFPKWVGDASFSNIVSLRLENCRFCCSLPPLGQLPSLQDLWIVGLDGVDIVGSEFYGIGSSSMKPFGALKHLEFSNMLEWKDWFPFEAENKGGAFPNLRELRISYCPKLTGGLPAHLPSLANLEISQCPQLVASLPRASSQRKLMLSNCNTILLNESPTGIHELSIKSCSKLKLPMHLNYPSFEYLTLDHCGFLKSFPLFPKLHHLIISNCGDLESLTVGEQHEHDLLLSQIQIHCCPNFAYFPQGGLRAPNLKVFKIVDCRSLRSLPEKMHILLPSLENLHIIDCPQVESFPEGGVPSNLNEIYIFKCDKLFASRMGWGLQNLPCVRRFSIGDKSEDVKSFPDEGLLPASLTYLHIEGFSNLKYLDKKGFQHLTALEKLEIWYCPRLECMPEDGLPASLSTLNIFGCPLLKKDGLPASLAHVPNIWMDD